MPLLHVLCVALSVSLGWADGHQPSPLEAIEKLAPHGSGICLAEVVAIRSFDNTGSCGSAGVTYDLRIIRSSGEVPASVTITTARGGLKLPGDEATPQRPPAPPIDLDALKIKRRYWFAFNWSGEARHLPPHWVEGDASVAPTMHAAINADVYRWRPHYDPTTRTTWGYLIEPAETSLPLPHRPASPARPSPLPSPLSGSWRVRAERDGQQVWEMTVPGEKTHLSQIDLIEKREGESKESPPTVQSRPGLLLGSKRSVVAENEHNIPAGVYTVNSQVVLESGHKVRETLVSAAYHLELEYDQATGRPRTETRFNVEHTGGQQHGLKTDQWARKVVKTYGGNGEPASERTYFSRYNTVLHATEWVPIER